MIPIALVTTDDYVLTRRGWNKVLWSGETGVNDVTEVLFSNGITLTGTKDHPIFTNNRWTPIDCLRYNEAYKITVVGVNQPCQKNRLNVNLSLLMELLTGDTLTRVTKAIDFTIVQIARVLLWGLAICTEIFGSITKGIFQKVFTSTTRTGTNLTIQSIILNAFPPRNIQPRIAKIDGGDRRKAKSTWTASGHWLHYGTSQKRAGRGTSNTQKTLHLTCSLRNIRASTVGIPFSQSHAAQICFAPINASQHGAGVKALITSLGRAVFAAQNLLLTNMQKLVHALALVGRRSYCKPACVNVVRMKNKGKVMTYNLLVEDAHEFFANGILVHNCDALRYAIASDIHFRSNQGKAKKTGLKLY